MAIDLYAMLRDHGVPAIDKRAGSDHSSASFNPKFLVCHHTASSAGSGDVPSLSIVRFGRGGPNPVPGPLAQIVLGRAGTTIVVTDGRANHPGMCDIEMINRAVQGLAPNKPPGDDDSGANASSKSYGIEAENNGLGEPWPTVQLERYIQICEAFCAEFGWGPGHFWGHKEITRRKIDPSFDMRWFRGEINSNETPKDWFDMATKAELEGIINPLVAEVQAVKADLATVKANQSRFEADTRILLEGTTVRKKGDNKQYVIAGTDKGLVKIHLAADTLDLLQKMREVGGDPTWNLVEVDGAAAAALDRLPTVAKQ